MLVTLPFTFRVSVMLFLANEYPAGERAFAVAFERQVGRFDRTLDAPKEEHFQAAQRNSFPPESRELPPWLHGTLAHVPQRFGRQNTRCAEPRGSSLWIARGIQQALNLIHSFRISVNELVLRRSSRAKT